MPPDQTHPLPFFPRVPAAEPASGGSDFDLNRAYFAEQARNPEAPLFLRRHAFLHLSLSSLEAGDRTRGREWLVEFSKFLETAPLDPAARASQKNILQGLHLLAEEDYLGAWKHFRSFRGNFDLQPLQKKFSRYWQKAHGRTLLEFLSLATESSEAAEGVWLRLRNRFQRTGTLLAAFESLEAADQQWIRARWDKGALEEIFAIAKTTDPEFFLNQLLELAVHWRGRGKARQAQLLLQLLEGKAGGDAFSYSVPDPIRKDATRIRSGGTLDGMGPSWGQELEQTLAAWTFSDTSRGFQTAGAWIGLATLACRLIPPLRPWASRGILILSEPNIAGAFLASGGYALYEGAPRAREAWHHLTGPARFTIDDALVLGGYSLGALSIGVGTASFALGGRYGLRFGLNARSLPANQGGARPAEAFWAGLRQADEARRKVMDPRVWVTFARSTPNLAPASRKFLEYGARAVDLALIQGTFVYATGRFLHDWERLESAPQDSNSGSTGGLLLQFGLNLFPAITLQLYRAGRGHSDSHLGPMRSEQMTAKVLSEPQYRETAISRVQRGLPKATYNQRDLWDARARREFPQVEALLSKLEHAEPLPPSPVMAIFAEPAPKGFALPADWMDCAPVKFSKEARFPPDLKKAREILGGMDLHALRRAYRSGQFSPLGVLRAIWDHPAIQEGATFPRSIDKGRLERELLRLAEESERRWEEGRPLVLDGVPWVQKDIWKGVDGMLNAGTKAGEFKGPGDSPVQEDLVGFGALPLPVGMVAAANGGTGLDSAFGRVPHPLNPELDTAGSSSATARMVADPTFPANWGSGSDTGGSGDAPAGACGINCITLPSWLLSIKGMIPFHTRLDRVALFSRFPKDAELLALILSRHVPSDPHMRDVNPGRHFQASPARPRVAYLKDLVDEVGRQFSPKAKSLFLEKMRALETQGWEVIPLGSDWNFLTAGPRLLYPWVAYPGAVFSFTNPLQENRFEAPRGALDKPILARLPFGAYSLEKGHYDRAMALGEKGVRLAREKLGPGVILASPSTVAIPVKEIQEGRAGELLDLHDDITMFKNWETNWVSLNRPHSEDRRYGIKLSGALPDLLHYLERPKFQPLSIKESPIADVPAVLPLRPAIDLERRHRVSEVRALRPAGLLGPTASQAEL